MENKGNKNFSYKTKDQNHVSQWKECFYYAQSPKEWRLLRELEFMQFEGWTLIQTKTEKKAFLAKPRNQNCVSK